MKIGVSLPVREIANDLAASSRHASGTRNLDYRYDALGNLTSKTSNVNADADVTGYTYSSTKPNALTSVRVGTENLTLTHDTVGNVTAINSNSGEDKAFTYNAHNLATSIRVTNHQGSRVAEETFEYGPDNQRYLKKTVSVSNGRTTTSYTVYAHGGKIERIIASNGYTTKKIRVTGKVTVRTTPSRYPRWSRVYHYALHRDHLGSVYTTTDDNGTAGTAITHDPFGGGRRHDWSRGSTQSERVASLESLAYRYVRTGLTGHEALERTGITHMNGRLYDPVIGRFLNADPYVQSPGFSQSHNRYSYVMNSPTGLVDPSGYRSCQSFGDTGSGDGDSGSTGFGFRITSCPGPTTPPGGLPPGLIEEIERQVYEGIANEIYRSESVMINASEHSVWDHGINAPVPIADGEYFSTDCEGDVRCVLKNPDLVTKANRLGKYFNDHELGELVITGGDSYQCGSSVCSSSTGEVIENRNSGSHHSPRSRTIGGVTMTGGNTAFDIRSWSLPESTIKGLSSTLEKALKGLGLVVLVDPRGQTDEYGVYKSIPHIHFTCIGCEGHVPRE